MEETAGESAYTGRSGKESARSCWSRFGVFSELSYLWCLANCLICTVRVAEAHVYFCL